jgi:PilZ domain
MSNIISMDDRRSKNQLGGSALRDRRYAIRYPFAADAELIDLASGIRTEGVTSDLSLGGCFVCTSRPFVLNGRTRITLKRKDLLVEAFGIVRIVKPRIGMGVEFVDLDPSSQAVLARWTEQLRNAR